MDIQITFIGRAFKRVAVLEEAKRRNQPPTLGKRPAAASNDGFLLPLLETEFLKRMSSMLNNGVLKIHR